MKINWNEIKFFCLGVAIGMLIYKPTIWVGLLLMIYVVISGFIRQNEI